LYFYGFSLIDLWALNDRGLSSRWNDQQYGSSRSSSFSWLATQLTKIQQNCFPDESSTPISKSLHDELFRVYVEFEKEKIKFQLLPTARMKSKRLLYLFQKDLIPGITGEILESKDSREQCLISPVTKEQKVLAWSFLALLDLGMLFYIFLFAINQDTHHQLAWGRSLALYLLLDITFISSFTVIFYHVLLPMMIHRDVEKIKKKLSESVRDYCYALEKKKEKELEEEEEKELHEEEDDEDDYDFGFELDEDDDDDDDDLDMDMLPHRKEKTKSSANAKESNKHNKNEEEKKQLPFDAVKYLFVSYRMAQLYAEDAGLPAAQLILNYSSPWPKQSYLRTVNLKGDFSESYTAVTRAISIVVIFFLTNLLATPIAIQDMILQMVTTVTFGYTLLVHIQLYQIFPALVIVPTSALLAISVYLRQWWLDRKKKNRMKKMKQVFPPEKKSDRCNRDIMRRGEPLIKGDENDDNANNEENDFNIDELSSDEDEEEENYDNTGRKQTFRSREPETTNKSLFDTRNTSKSKRGRGKRRRNLSINRRQSLKQGLQITSQIQRQLEALAEEEAEEEENKSSELSFVLDETGDDHEEDELDELSLSISSETIHSSDEAKQEL
jgi:hypothetical protein